MFRVIKYFTDLQDGGHAYNEGDIYPRAGLEPSPERIKELSGKKNKRKEPLIIEAQEPGTQGNTDGDTPPGGNTDGSN